jgi:hypothetical protein
MTEPEPTSSNAKVLFRVPGEDGTAEVETLWATKLGEDKYQIDNSPFYAYGVSWQDIVLAPFDQNEGFPTFQSVVLKSGHRTLRIIFDPPVENGNPSDQLLQVWFHAAAHTREQIVVTCPSMYRQTLSFKPFANI